MTVTGIRSRPTSITSTQNFLRAFGGSEKRCQVFFEDFGGSFVRHIEILLYIGAWAGQINLATLESSRVPGGLIMVSRRDRI